ncbi:MAG: hypothetical protein UX09_C0008G0001, partial [Candidatus Uhrbacteria bacterium GW2011_GWE2_45_35]
MWRVLDLVDRSRRRGCGRLRFEAKILDLHREFFVELTERMNYSRDGCVAQRIFEQAWVIAEEPGRVFEIDFWQKRQNSKDGCTDLASCVASQRRCEFEGSATRLPDRHDDESRDRGNQRGGSRADFGEIFGQ